MCGLFAGMFFLQHRSSCPSPCLFNLRVIFQVWLRIFMLVPASSLPMSKCVLCLPWPILIHSFTHLANLDEMSITSHHTLLPFSSSTFPSIEYCTVYSHITNLILSRVQFADFQSSHRLCNQHHFLIPEHFHCFKKKPISSHSPFLHPPNADCSISKDFPTLHMEVESYNTWSFITSCFYLELCFQDACMLQDVSVLHSF